MIFWFGFLVFAYRLKSAFQRYFHRSDPFIETLTFVFMDLLIKRNSCQLQKSLQKSSVGFSYMYHISSAFQRCRRNFDTCICSVQTVLIYFEEKMKCGRQQKMWVPVAHWFNNRMVHSTKKCISLCGFLMMDPSMTALVCSWGKTKLEVLVVEPPARSFSCNRRSTYITWQNADVCWRLTRGPLDIQWTSRTRTELGCF